MLFIVSICLVMKLVLLDRKNVVVVVMLLVVLSWCVGIVVSILCLVLLLIGCVWWNSLVLIGLGVIVLMVMLCLVSLSVYVCV